MTEWNLCELIETELLERFGYSTHGIDGVLVRQINEEHAVRLFISGFERGESNVTSATVELALARRDVNELLIDFLGIEDDWLLPTVSELNTRRFLNRPPSSWLAYDTSPDVVVAYLDRWIPPLDDLANLPAIEELLVYEDPDWPQDLRERLSDRRLMVRTLNQMLHGWRPRDEALLERRLASVAHRPPESKPRLDTEAQVQQFRDWIAEHPVGVERELTE